MQETRIVYFFTSASLVKLKAVADDLVNSCNDLLLATPPPTLQLILPHSVQLTNLTEDRSRHYFWHPPTHPTNSACLKRANQAKQFLLPTKFHLTPLSDNTG